jgi:selenocysteine lyase/cysteine desulfurase
MTGLGRSGRGLRGLLYLDNAATTLVKPPAVRKAAARAIRKCGNTGRGGHEASKHAAEVVFECRVLAARLFDVDSPERIIFTHNATHALNIAINSVVSSCPGAQGSSSRRVLISGYEHNSVLRPLLARKEEGIETVPVCSPPFEPELFLHDLENEMDRGADAVVCTHVSNVFGYILPVERVDSMCAERGIPLVIDASQSAGCLAIRSRSLRACRFICMSGHKGLMGPQGTGILICLDDDVRPFMFGGTGSDSKNTLMPDYLPDRLEAGTLNVPGIAGLAEGIRFVLKLGEGRILEHEREFTGRVIAGLEIMPKVKVFRSERLFCQTGVLSITLRGGNCEDAVAMLAARGICVRAGLHCSPLAHKSAGTLNTGTLRISPSALNRIRSADRFVAELGRVLREIQGI